MVHTQVSLKSRTYVPHIITAPEIRFTRFFDATDGKCWLWKGHIIKSGYGQFCPAKGVADGAQQVDEGVLLRLGIPTRFTKAKFQKACLFAIDAI